MVVILLLQLLVTGCGYRGPLYLPGESPPQDIVSTPIPGELPAGEESGETQEAQEEEEGETHP